MFRDLIIRQVFLMKAKKSYFTKDKLIKAEVEHNPEKQLDPGADKSNLFFHTFSKGRKFINLINKVIAQ